MCIGVVYSGEYDVCDVSLSVYPHWMHTQLQTFQLLEVKFRETAQWIELLFFCEKNLKIKSSEMAFPTFWEYVVISIL
jgi:hypothetical protein